ncbi:MAG TPA: hypothetical protein DIW46_06765 [Microbacterium sp.]|uniref:hypothetical protein n=1 Tax=Microbacterium sp. TaxID=51671 RepID=UPI000ECAB471|nr:hypothetical protein [Microbacterium sp.]
MTLGWTLAALLLLTTVAAIVWGISSAWLAAQSPNADAGGFWAAFTGPVGDTLGPVLSTLAILVTVFVAVFWQPKQNRLEFDARQEQNRASQVDGWVAESTDGRRFGVVVSNDADAVVFDLDLLISQGNVDREVEVGIDREPRLPRGTWFIEFIPDVDTPAHWRAPVPVRESDGMEVTLDPLVDDKVRLPGQHVLRPHVPQSIGGNAQPYFVLKEMRYSLHDAAWQRDERGRPIAAGTLDLDEDQRRETAGRLVRQEQRDRAVSSARVDDELESLVRYVIEVLCRTLQPDIEDLYAEAIGRELLVDRHVLPHVASLTRPGTGGQFHLKLTAPSGSLLKLVPSKGAFPHVVFMTDQHGEARFVIGGRNAGGVIKQAGARTIGLKNAGDLTARTTKQWMSTAAERWKLIEVLRTMVSEAAKAQEVMDSEESHLRLG